MRCVSSQTQTASLVFLPVHRNKLPVISTALRSLGHGALSSGVSMPNAIINETMTGFSSFLQRNDFSGRLAVGDAGLEDLVEENPAFSLTVTAVGMLYAAQKRSGVTISHALQLYGRAIGLINDKLSCPGFLDVLSNHWTVFYMGIFEVGKLSRTHHLTSRHQV